MPQKHPTKDWRKATQHLKNVRVVAIDEPLFFANEDTGPPKHIETIIDVLDHAYRDGITYVVFVHASGRLPNGIRSRRAVTRFAITRAAYTRSYVKRAGCRLLEDAVLAEIRERPSPAEMERRARVAEAAVLQKCRGSA